MKTISYDLVDEEINEDFKRVRDELIYKIPRKGDVVSRSLNPRELKHGLKKKGYTNVCVLCGEATAEERTGDGRRSTYFCSQDHSKLWNKFFYPKFIKERILNERGRRCEKSGCSNSEGLELHHKEPINGGGLVFKDKNLVLLCEKHHKEQHKELYWENKYERINEKHKSLDNFIKN